MEGQRQSGERALKIVLLEVGLFFSTSIYPLIGSFRIRSQPHLRHGSSASLVSFGRLISALDADRLAIDYSWAREFLKSTQNL